MPNSDQYEWITWLRYRYHLSREEAEDLVQDAFLHTWQALQYPDLDLGVDDLGRLAHLPLFKSILKRRVADHFRLLQKEHQGEIKNTWTPLPPSLEQSEWLDYYAALEVKEHMEPFWSQVLDWRIEGTSWQEISRRTGKPVSTLNSGLERHLDRVCAQLGYQRRKTIANLCVKNSAQNDMYYGGLPSGTTSKNNKTEVNYNETTQTTAEHHGNLIGGELERSSQHPRRRRRTQRGGVKCLQPLPLAKDVVVQEAAPH